MGYEVAIVNAFTGDHARTDAALLGNPAGVCLLAFYPPDEVMQAIATEVNLSETAFLTSSAENEYDLRWFTPTREIDLCGHATLASAHRLRELELIDTALPVSFRTQGGFLDASFQQQRVIIDLPNEPGHDLPVPAEVAAAFGVELTACQLSRANYLVEVASMHDLRNCGPDIEQIMQIEAEGIIVTADARSEGYDYAYRHFAPRLGIDEDPVTGSANCMLAEYWCGKLGKKKFLALQCSPRGGELQVELDSARVYVAGKAHTVEQLHVSGDATGPTDARVN